MNAVPTAKELEFIVSARTRIQASLLRLHSLHSALGQASEPGHSVGLLVGAAFSLWRAAPLVWRSRTHDSEVAADECCST